MSPLSPPSPQAAAVLSLTDVGRRFASGLEAVRQFDLELRDGEVVSLLGPSGCGKTTVLRMIAGLDRPSEGRIEGRDAPGRATPGSVGYVFQDATLMPWATVDANVRLPLRLIRTPDGEARERAAALIQLVGLSGFGGAHPAALSGGMRMRVSIARALVTRPRLLLMDEPFAALDEITRFRLNEDLLRLRDEVGCTVLFVTHSVYESVWLSNRVAVMTARPGRVAEAIPVELGPRTAALRQNTAYVALCGTVSEALARAMAAGGPA
jgi:NitT/TauT family transport system ATP-binding protein